MPVVQTVDEMRDRVRERADMVNNNFVTDGEINEYIAQSYYELYDLLIQKYGENYYVMSGNITTDGSSSQYSLYPPFPPSGALSPYSSDIPFNDVQQQTFYKLLGVDLKLTPQSGQEAWVTIRPFQFAERNRYAVPNMQSFYGLTNLRYRLNGDNLWLTPTPAAGQELRYWYIPRPVTLAASASIIFKADYSWYAGTDNFAISYDGSYNLIPMPIIDPLSDGFGTVDLTLLSNFINANTFFGQISSSAGTASDGVNLELSIYSNKSKNIWWDASDTHGRAAEGSLPRLIPWNGTADGVSGWTEYIIVDAAIKCMQKEESDTSVLMAQKQALIARIEAAAANRDAGNPAVVSDSQWSDFWLPMGQGGIGGGGGY